MKKILIAVDNSEASMKAVNYVAEYFSKARDLEIKLLNILPELPPSFWDEGHLLDEEERSERNRAIKSWEKNHELEMEKIFKSAVDTLIKKGEFKNGQIETKVLLRTGLGAAGDILDEARKGGYKTIVLGRKSHMGTATFLMGSVSTKVVNHGTGLTICVVE